MRAIAYLGPEKTNTHFAALARFGRAGRYLHAPTVEEVFELVERQKADFGVVPVENSLEGAVTHTLDRFVDFRATPVRIYGEIEQPIQHFLITHRGSARHKIRTVYSHPQALAQCSRWLREQMGNVACVETSSTAEAVERIKRIQRLADLRSQAAIGRREQAQASGLEARPIPIDRENRTRFLILSLAEPRPGRRNKTSVLFALKDKPGALHNALLPFKREGINLTKIESRPSKRKAWEYLFFIDFEGHVAQARVQKALAGLKRSSSLVKVLGSYPVG